MESEIQKSVKLSIKNLSTSPEEESGIQTDWEEKVKDYVNMVLNEKEKMIKSLSIVDFYEVCPISMTVTTNQMARRLLRSFSRMWRNK